MDPAKRTDRQLPMSVRISKRVTVRTKFGPEIKVVVKCFFFSVVVHYYVLFRELNLKKDSSPCPRTSYDKLPHNRLQ